MYTEARNSTLMMMDLFRTQGAASTHNAVRRNERQREDVEHDFFLLPKIRTHNGSHRCRNSK